MGGFILGHFLQYLYLLSGLKCFFRSSNEVHICVLSRFNHVWLFATPRTVVLPPLSGWDLQARIMHGLPCPSLGTFPDVGIGLGMLWGFALVVDYLPVSESPEVSSSEVTIFSNIHLHVCNFDPVSFSLKDSKKSNFKNENQWISASIHILLTWI